MKEQNSPKKDKKKEVNGVWVLLFFLLALAGVMLLHTLTGL
ncbi:MAG: hypothetical protein P8X42_04935 [Calditrichaceae bacterium]|jgi:hypothetical protein